MKKKETLLDHIIRGYLTETVTQRVLEKLKKMKEESQ